MIYEKTSRIISRMNENSDYFCDRVNDFGACSVRRCVTTTEALDQCATHLKLRRTEIYGIALLVDGGQGLGRIGEAPHHAGVIGLGTHPYCYLPGL